MYLLVWMRYLPNVVPCELASDHETISEYTEFGCKSESPQPPDGCCVASSSRQCPRGAVTADRSITDRIAPPRLSDEAARPAPILHRDPVCYGRVHVLEARARSGLWHGHATIEQGNRVAASGEQGTGNLPGGV